MMLLASAFLGMNLYDRTAQLDGHTITYNGWPSVYALSTTYEWNTESAAIQKRLRDAIERGGIQSDPELYQDMDESMDRGKRHMEAMKKIFSTPEGKTPAEIEYLPYWRIAGNIGVALGIMLVIAVSMELYIRHQES